MPKHGKDFVIPSARTKEEPSDYNIWALLNPEFAYDDWVIDALIEREDDELTDSTSAIGHHGFNGHDPLSEVDGFFFDDFESQNEMDDLIDDLIMSRWPHGWNGDQAAYQLFAASYTKYFKRRLKEAALRREIEAEFLEARYQHLPFIQSTRMRVRELVNGDSYDCDWNRRRAMRYGKRNKPSHRPFVKDRYKGA